MTPPLALADAALSALCDRVGRLAWHSVPPDVRERAVLVVADELSCAIAAAGDAEARRHARALAPDRPPRAPTRTARAFDSRRPLDAPTAAARNATYANWWQLDGGHHRLMCHAALYVVPAALAEAQAADASVADWLAAVVAGYELTCSLAQALAHGEPPLHPHATLSAAGALAAIARLRRWQPARWRGALHSLLANAPAVPFTAALEGELAVNTLAGQGILRAFVAADGLPAEVADARPPRPVRTPRARSQPAWALREAYHKEWGCAAQALPALQALLAARAQAGSGAAMPDWIEVRAHAFAGRMMQQAPATSLAARFSIPHLLAVAWLHGRTDPQAFGAELLHDPGVCALRQRVRFLATEAAAPPPFHRAARVVVATPLGHWHGACRAARGSPGLPLSRDDIVAKVRRQAGRQLDAVLALLQAGGDSGRPAGRVRELLAR